MKRSTIGEEGLEGRRGVVMSGGRNVETVSFMSRARKKNKRLSAFFPYKILV